jgi:CDGSH-type Zn-finger protein/truncated hemoglobin YjbI
MSTPHEGASTTVRPGLGAEMVADLQRLAAEADSVAEYLRRLAAESAPSATTDMGAFLVAAPAVLENSVVRPLKEVLRGDDGVPAAAIQSTSSAVEPAAQAAVDGAAGLTKEVRALARLATSMRVKPGAPAQLLEATAALQDLACLAAALADPTAVAAALEEFAQLQAGMRPQILASLNGPYLVTNVPRVTNWLGEAVPTRPQLALCRCGASGSKPLCDGSHARIGFTAQKSPDRVPDQRDAYVGQQVTVFDNRGICQHSGLCTDRLATVFHTGTEPFVTPSGGRMDEIVRAVRDCPSGALSFAIDSAEARDQVDHARLRPAAIEVTKDGPYRVSGRVDLFGADGTDEPRAEGSSREHYALCRCGQSRNKPFCSGMHWYVNFHDPAPAEQPTVFEWAGGLPALTRMTRIFYEKYIPQDPLLAPVFAKMSDQHPQLVAAWLSEVFGGPKNYSEHLGGYVKMISQHVGKVLTEEKRTRWVQLLVSSANDAGLPNDPEFRSVLSSYIEWGSRLAVENSQLGVTPPPHMPMPHWEWHTAAGEPGSRIPAQPAGAAIEEHSVVLPGVAEQVLFGKHIKPLFRKQDQASMSFVFDLWSYDEVKLHADAILDHLQKGSMPCDGAWSADKVEVFKRWHDTNMLA